MEEEAIQEDADKEWKAKQEEMKLKDEKKRSKNAERRAKTKDKKGKVKGGDTMDVDAATVNTVNGAGVVARSQNNGSGQAATDVYEGAPVAEEGGIVIHDDD